MPWQRQSALAEGETLDGEHGYTVYGKVMPAADSLALGGLPIGLAHGCKLVRAVEKLQAFRRSDIHLRESDAVSIRREMEQMFRSPS